MKSKQSISNLLINPWVLYIIFAIVVVNLFGYMMAGDLNFILLFILISLIIHLFTKNMIIILAISLLVVSFVKGGFVVKESLVNSKKSTFFTKQRRYANFHDHDPSHQIPEYDDEGIERMANREEDEEEGFEGMENIEDDEEEGFEGMGYREEEEDERLEGMENMEEEDERVEGMKGDSEEDESGEGKGGNIVMNSSAAASSSLHETIPESFEVGKKNKSQMGSRIDYSSTVEQAYDNLDKILGGDGIQKLTGDTQKLMEQQMKLAEAMKNMGPLLENANKMLTTINTSGGGIENLLKNSGGIQNLLGNIGK